MRPTDGSPLGLSGGKVSVFGSGYALLGSYSLAKLT